MFQSTMSNIRKKNGDIFEIPLAPYHDLYVYAKFFDISTVEPKATYHQVLYVYDFFSHTPIQFWEDIATKNLFLNPVYISGGNGLTKIFRLVDRPGITDDEIIIPPFRIPIPFNAYDKNIPVEGWEVRDITHQLIISPILPFEDVCHLDIEELIIYINLLSFRISLELDKRNQTYPTDISSYDIVQKLIHRHVIEMPLLSEIPESRRFKFPY
jgi:hypothetical protein